MSSLLFGLSRNVITPAEGVHVSLAGYFNKRWQTGKLDDIYTRALAVSDGKKIAVLCQFDLIRAPLVDDIRKRCEDIPGLCPMDIAFMGIHTHTAPGINPQMEGNDLSYTDFVNDMAVKTIHEAVADLRPGTPCYAETEESRFAFNRRYWMKDGNVVTNPKRKDPQIDKPEGPMDPRIGIFGIKNPDGSLRMLLANISNHLDTIGGNLVSADWQCMLRDDIEAAIPGVIAWGMTSASGNINHFDPAGGPDQTSYAVATRIGKGYAAATLAALPKLKDLDGDGFAMASRIFDVGPRELPEDEIAEARATVAKYADATLAGGDLTSEDLANKAPIALKIFAQRLLDIVDKPRTYKMEINVLRIANMHVIVFPGEPFVEHAFYVREDVLKRQPCLISAHGVGEAGYVPNRYNYGRGGYETQALSSKTTLETGNIFRTVAAELIAETDK